MSAGGMASPASVPGFRRLHAGDQGAHCRPLDPASLSLFRGGRRGIPSSPTALASASGTLVSNTGPHRGGPAQRVFAQGECP